MSSWRSAAGASADRIRATVGLAVWLVACLLPLDGDGVGWLAGRFVLLAALVWVPLDQAGGRPPGLLRPDPRHSAGGNCSVTYTHHGAHLTSPGCRRPYADSTGSSRTVTRQR